MRKHQPLLFQHQVYPHHLAVELLAMGARNIKPYLALIVAIARFLRASQISSA